MTPYRNAHGIHKEILLYHMTTMDDINPDDLCPRWLKITGTMYPFAPACHLTTENRTKLLDGVAKRAYA